MMKIKISLNSSKALSINSGETLPLPAVAVASPGGGRAGPALDRGRSQGRGGLARKVLAEVGPAYRPLGFVIDLKAAARTPSDNLDHLLHRRSAIQRTFGARRGRGKSRVCAGGASVCPDLG